MGRSSKCRVLVSGGVAVAQEREAPQSAGLRLEVGKPFVKPTAKLAKPKPDDDDPRDVPLWKPAAVLEWALDNGAWNEQQRRVLGALLIAGGDIASVAKRLKVSVEYTEAMLLRAKSEVKFAAKEREWVERFLLERREPVPYPGWISFRISMGTLWFYKIDRLCWMFDMDRRVAPYA